MGQFRKNDFLVENFTQKTWKNYQIEVVGPTFWNALYDMYDQNQFDCLMKRFDGEECLVQEIDEEIVGGAHNVTGDI